MFCVRGFGGGVGVSLFFGGCSGLSVVFSRASGVLCVSRSFCSCLLGWGRVAGVPGFGVWCARAACFLLVGGRVWGAPARARFLSCPVLAVVGVGGRVRGCARRPVPAVLWWGSGCARFPVRVRGVVVVFAGGFRVLFFPSGASRVLLVSGVGLRGLAGGRGVVGGVGLGSGLFFLRLLLYWPGLVSGFLLWGAGLGLGWVLFGEFDPGSGRTLAACLTHASRTGPPSFLGGGLSGERVSIT